MPPSVELALIVIDNRSTDDTQGVLASFQQSEFARQHSVIIEQEPRQGHTFSRNRAISLSQSDLVIWTDDDVLVPTNWVQRYVDVANRETNIDFFGGHVRPCFPAGRPNWIEQNWDKLKGCFADRDLGTESIHLQPDRLPYGANFAVRGDTQRLHPFDEELGRRGQQVLGEDELELMRRMLAAGHQGLWIPDIAVQHQIPPDRATTDYVHDYFVGQGRSLVATGKNWSQEPRQLLEESKREYRRFRWKRWYASSETWCSHLLRSALAKGQALELESQIGSTS